MPNPFLSIWIHPRTTVRAIIAENSRRYVWLLACLACTEGTFGRAENNGGPDAPALPYLILLVCGIGIVFGPFLLWVGSLLFRWTGTWLGGTASTQQLQTALAWAAVPAAMGLLLWIPRLALFGEDLFTGSPIYLGTQPAAHALFAFAIVDLLLGVWHWILVCNTVAGVQGFRSAWLGLVNLLLGGLVLIIPTLLLAVGLVGLLRG